MDGDAISKAKPIFSESNNPTKVMGILFHQTGSGKSTMVATKMHGSTYISACILDRSAMSTAKPMFSGSSNPTELLRILSHLTESENPI